jgi:GNAT superfamily N-acetyltransferase
LGRGGLDCSNERPLLVDRYEVTRREWSEFLGSWPAKRESAGLVIWERWEEQAVLLPATYMDRAEALEFAALEGMRLPTQREWLRISAGTRAQAWPWGPSPARSVANTLDLGVGSPLGVGTFGAGATPSGVFDLIGNAREWVASEGDGWENEELAAAMGGSWLSHQQPLHQWNSTSGLETSELLVDARHRSIDLGLRLVADAEEFLRGAASSWGTSPNARARVVAVGERWGAPAVELLEAMTLDAAAHDDMPDDDMPDDDMTHDDLTHDAAARGGAVGIAWLLEGARS